jgi:MSHA biogenesis protein MshP
MVSGIFVLVVLALLGAFIMSVTSTQGGAEALDVGGTRALQAARSGIDWGIAQVTDPRNTDAGLSASPPTPPACFATGTPALGAEFDNMTVSVACVRTATTEGNRQVAIFNITATANGGGGGYPLQRQVQATVSRCTDPAGAAPRYACP